MDKRWMAGALVAAVLLAGCSGNGGKSEASDKPTTTAAKAEATTTTTEVDLSEAGDEFQSLAEEADQAIDDEIDVRDGYAADNDLQGGIDSTRDLRNALFDFDAGVRKLDVPDEQAGGLNDVLTETGSYIAVLDEYLDITEITDYNVQLDDEASARVAWYEAVNAFADDLGVDGVEDDVDDSSSSTTSTSDDEDAVPAGDTIATGTESIEVPEGFTGTATSTILLSNGAGGSIGIYTVYPEDGTDTLDAVAEESATGAAEKNGYDVVGGPEDVAVGDYDGIGYAYEDSEGTSMVDIFFEAEDTIGNEWHLISVVAPNEDIEDVMSALDAVLDTVVIS